MLSTLIHLLPTRTFYRQDPRARPALLFHGRQVPRLLHHHHRLLARTDRRGVRRLLAGAVPADRRQGTPDRGLLVSAEVSVGRDGLLLGCPDSPGIYLLARLA